MEKSVISSREAEILTMISKGNSSLEIARQLNISHHTVITHRKNILRKLRVSNSLQAITMLFQQQIIVKSPFKDHSLGKAA